MDDNPVVAAVFRYSSLATAYWPSVILPPDGTHLAFAARGADPKPRIYVRALDQLQASALFGTENGRDPFFSPDVQGIAFFAEGQLYVPSVPGSRRASGLGSDSAKWKADRRGWGRGFCHLRVTPLATRAGNP